MVIRVRNLPAIALTAAIAGCGPAGELCTGDAEGPPSLIDHSAWLRLPVDEDPFEAGPEDVIYPCTDQDMGPEVLGDRPSWTVETGSCNWATVAQPLERALAEGDELRVEVFWYSQRDFPSGLAVVGLAIGDDIVLEREVPIPAESSLLDVTVTLPRDAPAGTPVCFHVGNHGTNSWNLLDVTLVEEPGAGLCEEAP